MLRRGFSKTSLRGCLALLAIGGLLGALLAAVPVFNGKAHALSGAAFTATDVLAGTGACLNGKPDSNGDVNNCNLYQIKQDVWLNAGPVSGQIGPGTYFFAVVAPGGTNNPNDGSAKNLSSPVDPWQNREFTINADGSISYSGTHVFDTTENKIQLFPYNDTPNHGGVYIMVVCAVPASPNPVSGVGAPGATACKTDAFKVEASSTPVVVNSVFTGTKWLDSDGDGVFSPTETGLQGWTIDISTVSGGVTTPVTSVTTDASGSWSYTTPDTSPTSGTTEYQFCEVLQTGWLQTGPNATDATTANGTATGGATVALDTSPGTDCYDVTVPNNAQSTAGSLDFFNQPTGDFSGAKYYDLNTNGQLDTGEVQIPNWEITITGTNTAGAYSKTVTTDSLGNFSLSGLLPGTYTVTEVHATNGGWTQTGNTVDQASSTGGATQSLSSFSYSITVPNNQPSTVSGLYFGNVCHVTGGLTLGFWSNKNGQKILSSNWASVVSLINSTLWLVNADGSRFTVSGTPSTGYTQLRNWLLNATSKNASYMLSVQLLTTAFDRHFGTLADYTVTDPVTGNPITIDDLIVEVGASGTGFIEANPNTTAAGTARTDAGEYEALFDAINNNQVVLSGPSACAAPIFP